jgi:hypothetical protein
MLVEPPQSEQDNYKYLMTLEDELTNNLYEGLIYLKTKNLFFLNNPF